MSAPPGLVRGFAPGVNPHTNTFTCPKCGAKRDCQQYNPMCLACLYRDPRVFTGPEDGAEVEFGEWQPLK